MTNKPTGGQAYPSFPASINSQFQYQGMTMRDAFAIAAIKGLLSDMPKTCYGLDWKENVSREAWEIADAMILEREK